MKFVNGTKLDGRLIRTDLDPGFKEGRQFGRGRSGGQVRDEYRQEYDEGRGGYGHIRAMQEEERRRQMMVSYEAVSQIPTGASAKINSRLGGPEIEKQSNKRRHDSSDEDEMPSSTRRRQEDTEEDSARLEEEVGSNEIEPKMEELSE
ncbi:Nuclear cap-binding protein subunit 2 [Smittium culicis]|uniref:Nuclear cap-binding protein subunit 2 n=1 Tax=Smittium culicis TaxID=133412 RepID=A0A1R1XRU4_9FUNG|nr:Nuclear cap-binding protein subunit 2 [Smittium culicis]OMJ17387.1 Nuclear cap-binding protein subunit 2 [Smittium culicis]